MGYTVTFGKWDLSLAGWATQWLSESGIRPRQDGLHSDFRKVGFVLGRMGYTVTFGKWDSSLAEWATVVTFGWIRRWRYCTYGGLFGNSIREFQLINMSLKLPTRIFLRLGLLPGYPPTKNTLMMPAPSASKCLYPRSLFGTGNTNALRLNVYFPCLLQCIEAGGGFCRPKYIQ